MSNSNSKNTHSDNLNNTKKNKKHIGNLLENKGILKTMLILGLPLFFVFVSDSIFFFIDSSLIFNMFDSTNAALPVIKSLSFSYYKMFLAFALLFLIGVSMFYSYKIGKGEEKEYVQKIIGNGMSATLVVSVVMFFIFGATLKPYLTWISNTALTSSLEQDAFIALIPSAFQYMSLFAFGIVFVLLRNNYMRILRIEGHMNIATTITMIFYPIWILLDWVFMGPCNLGMMGAGLSYFVSALVVFMITLILVRILQKKQKTLISFKFRTLIWNKKILLTIFALSVPTTIWNLGFNSNEVVQSWMFSSLSVEQEQYANLFTAYQLGTTLSSALTITVTTVMAMVIGYMLGKNMKQKTGELLTISAFVILGVNLIVLITLNATFIQIANLVKIDDPSFSSGYFNAWLLLTCSLTIFQSQGFMSTLLSATKRTKYAVIDSVIKFFLIGIPLQFIFFYGIFIPTGGENVFYYLSYLPIWVVLSSIYLIQKYIKVKREILI